MDLNLRTLAVLFALAAAVVLSSPQAFPAGRDSSSLSSTTAKAVDSDYPRAEKAIVAKD